MGMKQLETISLGRVNTAKKYESPRIKQQLVETEQLLKQGSIIPDKQEVVILEHNQGGVEQDFTNFSWD